MEVPYKFLDQYQQDVQLRNYEEKLTQLPWKLWELDPLKQQQELWSHHVFAVGLGSNKLLQPLLFNFFLLSMVCCNKTILMLGSVDDVGWKRSWKTTETQTVFDRAGHMQWVAEMFLDEKLMWRIEIEVVNAWTRSNQRLLRA